MTESQKSGAVSSNNNAPTEKEALKMEKQKCKVLKAALKDEKRARSALDEELKAAMAKIEHL